MRRRLVALLLALCAARPAAAVPIDWARVADDAAARLSAYLRIDSSNPPGDTRAAAAFLAAELRAAGIESEQFGAAVEKPFLLARVKGSGGPGKPIVLLNHMDVVPADAARWSVPPFGGEVRDGVVYGRGALDMKGLAISMLTALRLLAERGERPGHDLVFLAVPDEEVGATQGTAWLEQHRPDLLDAAAVWDEGGIGITDLLPAPALFISVTEKQVLWLRLIAEGPSGHGSRPFPGAAPRRLTQALTRLLDNPPAPRLTPVAREVFRNVGAQVGGMEGFAMRRLSNPVVWLFADGLLQQEPWSVAMTRDTLALTMLDAGYKPNVIPERAEAVLDCRLLPDTKPQAFIEQLRKEIDDPGITFEILQAPESAPTSPTDTPLYEAMLRATHTVYPGVVVTPSMTTGGTDSRFFRQRGVPAYGFFPVLLSKQLTGTVHGVDERIPVSALGQATQVIYEALKQL
ncbi:MAG: M20/M25/M40 family metallo-hydrolase [Deltaproteobacteria bacterium]|nr:M20/M25/M40 family metallo-hydrolase [Deltaproteobacteria bacterium]